MCSCDVFRASVREQRRGAQHLLTKGRAAMGGYLSGVLRYSTGTFVLLLALSSPAHADEGFWTFDNFPASKVAAKYSFAPSQAWLQHVRSASLRLTGSTGCSASFISPNGLDHDQSPLRGKLRSIALNLCR